MMRKRFCLAAGRYLLSALLSWGGCAVHAANVDDPLLTLPTAAAVLGALSPPTSLERLESGNELLLESPDIVRSGIVKIRMMSAMPRTDAMWLLNLSPPAMQASPLPYLPSGKKTTAESTVDKPKISKPSGALLASFRFKTDQPPEEVVEINLDTTQTLLLVARAGGRYFGVKREVKVGYPEGSRKDKP